MKLVRLYWYSTRGTENVPYKSTEDNWADINPQYIREVYPHENKPGEYVYIMLNNNKTYLTTMEWYNQLELWN